MQRAPPARDWECGTQSWQSPHVPIAAAAPHWGRGGGRGPPGGFWRRSTPALEGLLVDEAVKHVEGSSGHVRGHHVARPLQKRDAKREGPAISEHSSAQCPHPRRDQVTGARALAGGQLTSKALTPESPTCARPRNLPHWPILRNRSHGRCLSPKNSDSQVACF